MYPKYNFDPQPKKIESLYQGRIRQFTDPNGEYHKLNLAGFYDLHRTNSKKAVSLEVYSVPDLKRPSFKEAMKSAEWRPAKTGDTFGPSWSTHWFKVKVTVPKKYTRLEDLSEPHERPLFEFCSSNEGLIYLKDGTPVIGLSDEHNRTEWILPKSFLDGESHTFYIETSCNDIQGNGSPPREDRTFELKTADIVVPNSEARALYYDFWIIGDASREFPEDSWQKHAALDVCNRIINEFDPEHLKSSLRTCRKIAREYLGKYVDSSSVYDSGKKHSNPKNPVTSQTNLVYAIGNCHIDTAWLWPFAETHRKVARSWASQLDLLERYPEYRFTASQAQQFKWLLNEHPDLFKRLQGAVKKGSFCPVGGSWVESDSNMPSGESLARQLLLGQKFFETHFGSKSKVYWLPDTFGYCPQLPQLCRLADMDYFLTQKLSWNNINVHPNTTFNWVGLDGSQVLCHMPPANTYTAAAHFGDVKRSLEQHKNLDVDQHGLLLFGYGDGGGGPTAEMLEKLRRCRGLSNTVGGLPRVESGATPNDFFSLIRKSTHNGAKLPSWVGELYLEYHRGTYTTQAAIKRGNRESETLMYNLEFLATLASLESEKYEYPFAEIRDLWEKICINQFHDVLPGSSIGVVYDVARETYRKVLHKGNKLLDEALESLGFGRFKESATGKVEKLSTLPWTRSDRLAKLGKVSDFKTHHKLSNGLLTVSFVNGDIRAIYDHVADREVLVKGTVGNRLLLFEDQPLNFPAWDTEVYATEKFKVLEAVERYVESDRFVNIYEFNKSSVRVDITLKGRQVEFEVSADWHETYQFLKAEFIVDVASDTASFETAFGVQKRPTHYNTTWDAAKFEQCAHRFADLSDYSYGVSLINDSKYGYSIHGKGMRLSLLRSPKSPDAHADMGKHHFRYALFPHEGPLSHETVRAAAEFNNKDLTVCYPMNVVPTDLNKFLVVNAPNVMISSIKRAEDDLDASKNGPRSVIIRLYETLGGKVRTKLRSFYPIKRVFKVNILEEKVQEVGEPDVLTEEEVDEVPLELDSFEIVTLRIQLSGKKRR